MPIPNYLKPRVIVALKFHRDQSRVIVALLVSVSHVLSSFATVSRERMLTVNVKLVTAVYRCLGVYMVKGVSHIDISTLDPEFSDYGF